MADHISFNGKIIPSDQPIYTASSRAARFGDGIFETMRVRKGKILFEELHIARLLMSLELMQIELSDELKWATLYSSIVSLLEKNGNPPHARVRLMITRGDGSIMEEPTNSSQVLVETWEANDYLFNEKGLKVDVYSEFPRSRNAFSMLKTCNFLPSVMAAKFAKENKLDESLLINDAGRICDATISNIFWVRDGQIFTNAFSEGQVMGVMRTHLILMLHKHDMPVTESLISPEELKQADEIFLTNVIRGVQWVGTFGDRHYENKVSRKIFSMLLDSIA